MAEDYTTKAGLDAAADEITNQTKQLGNTRSMVGGLFKGMTAYFFNQISELIKNNAQLQQCLAPISILYADLLTLQQNNNLVVGKYIITDFVTDYFQDNDSTRHLIGINEPLLIAAISTNQFDARVISTLYPSDEILYNIYGNGYTWNTPTSKGQIYYRKDAQNNETDFDFRAVLTRRYPCDASGLQQWDAGTYYPVNTWIYSPEFDAIYFCPYSDSNIIGANPTATWNNIYWVLVLQNVSTTLYCKDIYGLYVGVNNNNNHQYIIVPSLTSTPIDLPTFGNMGGEFDNNSNNNNSIKTGQNNNYLPQLAVQTSSNINIRTTGGLFISNSNCISDCFLNNCIIINSYDLNFGSGVNNSMFYYCQYTTFEAGADYIMANNLQNCKIGLNSLFCLISNCVNTIIGASNSMSISFCNDCQIGSNNDYVYLSLCSSVIIESNLVNCTYLYCFEYRVKSAGRNHNVQFQHGGSIDSCNYDLTLPGANSYLHIAGRCYWDGIIIPYDNESAWPAGNSKEAFVNSNTNKAFVKYYDYDNNLIFLPLN